MLNPGTLVGNALQANSMARAIEDAMVAAALIDLGDETPEAALERRKAYIAIATGVINHLKAHIEIHVAANRFGNNLPQNAVTLLGSAQEVR